MDYHPEDWNDVLVYLIVGLPAIIGAVAAAHHQQRKAINGTRDLAEQTLYEVKNDHRSNLRDDIDDLTVAVREGFKGMHTEIAGLREELRTERIERIEGDRRHS